MIPDVRVTSLFAVSVAILIICPVAFSTPSEPDWPGAKSTFDSFDQFDFEIDELKCRVVVPRDSAEGKPWVWRARFFGHEPQTDIALLEEGFHVAYVDVAGLFGSPKAVQRWNLFYDYLTREHLFSKKPALEGFSRGGLIIYNWASANPDKVSCIYADAPVCDFKSWPMKWSSRKTWEECLAVYGFTEAQALAYDRNPIDNLKPLAEAGIPLLHVVGDADVVVPVSENTALIEERYKDMGGVIRVLHKPGIGHHPHSLTDPAPIVSFIKKYAR